MPAVVKRDGTREPFDEQKLRAGLMRALEKRPVSADQVESCVSRIKHVLRETGERELASRRVGEAVMNALRDVDPVAYVRFASVYRDFQDVSEFRDEVDKLSGNDGSPEGQLSLLGPADATPAKKRTRSRSRK